MKRIVSPAERARRGEEILDEKCPNWRAKLKEMQEKDEAEMRLIMEDNFYYQLMKKYGEKGDIQ